VRHRSLRKGLDGETLFVEGPDDDLEPEAAAYYAKAPERWCGRFFVRYPIDPLGERRVFEMRETLTEEGEALFQWDRVTDQTVLEKIR
jgi:hypothetical protein